VGICDGRPAERKQPAAVPAAPRQAFLDLGQRGLSQRTCAVCGMCYDPAFREDTRRHERFHQAHLDRDARLMVSLPSAGVASLGAAVGVAGELLVCSEPAPPVSPALALFF
jgi:hypothetical protein